MRIYELLESQSKEEAIDNVKQFAQTIKNDCQPYLSQVTNPLGLYRGTDDNQRFSKVKVRLSGRRPYGMTLTEKDQFNDGFISAFGEPFRDSLMCTGDVVHVGQFGKVNHVFPIGNFTFCWSPQVDDINYFIDEISNEDRMKLYANPVQYGYKTTDLQTAVTSGNELMIRVEHAYLLRMSYIRRYSMQFNTNLLDVMKKVLV